MSWSGLANNQTVSFSNLRDAVDTSVFLAKTTQTISNEQVTKADAEAKVYLDTTTAAWSALSNNQLPIKSDFTAATTYTVSILAAWGLSTSNYNYEVYAYYDSTAEQYMGLVTSTTCTDLGSLEVPSGATLKILARRSVSPNDPVYINGSFFCPSNVDNYCEFNAGTITANDFFGITIYINGSGNPRSCT
jgi:hypothetical protein